MVALVSPEYVIMIPFSFAFNKCKGLTKKTCKVHHRNLQY
jgi:hypothetical protein